MVVAECAGYLGKPRESRGPHLQSSCRKQAGRGDEEVSEPSSTTGFSWLTRQTCIRTRAP